ncbi:chemotaxis protein CheC [Magnetococcus sp. PR-3]|uniref:chemotaxis protein CheC n=1 Tax=Magnetococcus sp. PR-3 TaxID=3120355 RepID=UPI002FCE4866
MVDLDALKRDALGEAFNIGVGRAAASLSALLGEEIEISIPQLNIQAKRPAIDRLASELGPSACSIKQRFNRLQGEHVQLQGHAMLFFPGEAIRALGTALLGTDQQQPEGCVHNSAMLQEVGNILLNACMGSVANLLQMELECHIPEVYVEDPRQMLVQIVRSLETRESENQTEERRRPEQEQDQVIQVSIHFKALSSCVSGNIMMFLDLTTAEHLHDGLQHMLRSMGITNP